MDRIAYDRSRGVYKTPTEIIFSKEPFYASGDGMMLGVAGMIGFSFSLLVCQQVGLLEDMPEFLWFFLGALALSVFFFLFCLISSQRRKSLGGILPQDRLTIYDAQSRFIKQQRGTTEEIGIGSCESFPVLFNVRMHRQSRRSPQRPYWSLSLAQLDQTTGRATLLFSSFQQTLIQVVRDALKEKNIPMGLARDDGTPAEQL